MSSHYDLRDTIVALSTPRGQSGIAVIRLTGRDAIRIVGSVLPAPEQLYASIGNSSFHGSIVDSAHLEIDDVVVQVFRAPKSFTGEDVVEICSHGSEAIIDAILNLIVERGARVAEPGEFSRRAFYNKKLDLLALEGIQTKLAANDTASLRGASLALQEKFKTLRDVYDTLIEILAEVNAQIDFGDSDDIHFDSYAQKIEITSEKLKALIFRSRVHSANTGNFTIAFVGPPNVGKSSIFNKLLSFERSIVSAHPGTTRDYLEAFIDLDGHKIKIIDTAGDRETAEFIESIGIERGREASRRADITFYVTDAESRVCEPPPGMIVLHNKVDIDGWNAGLSVSALNGFGIADLLASILSLAREVDPMSLAIPVAERALLENILHQLGQISEELEISVLAEEIRFAIDELAALLGVNIGEDALNRIFQSMCIGK